MISKQESGKGMIEVGKSLTPVENWTRLKKGTSNYTGKEKSKRK